MSVYYGKHGKPREIKHSAHGVTKQSFKDQCDINKILERAARVGGLSHFEKHGAVYADFSEFDFMEAQNKIAQGTRIFEELPAEIRREFNQDPQAFFSFAADPANAERITEILPKIAERGNYFPPVNRIQKRADAPPAASDAPSDTNPDSPPKEG